MSGMLKFIDHMSRLAETVAVALVFGYTGLMLAEVVARAQAASLSFSWEYSQYAMAAVFALAAGPAIRARVHVRITLLSDRLPRRVAHWMDIAANLTALVVAALMVQAMAVKVGTSWERDILATTITRTPLWVPQALVLWGLAQLWLDLFARLVRLWRGEPAEWPGADAEAADV